MYPKRFLIISIAFIATSLFVNSSIAQTTEINLSFIGDKTSLAYKGVKQGKDEANIQGKFLGQQYAITASPESSTAILAALDADTLRQLSRSYPNKAIFNLISAENKLRTECLPNVLHIIPSQAMKQDAIAQWQKKRPEESVKAQTWHPSFRKYAAGQLNVRFIESSNIEMNDTAWAGWAAVKLLSDSVVRSQLKDAAQLLNFIKTKLAFDGQKGMSLSFRKTGQLRQPILLIKDNKIIGEAPVRGIANTTNLDSLGLTSCLK